MGERREVNKLLNSGLVRSLSNEIRKSPDIPHLINCVWALSNLAATDVSTRDAIVRSDPNLFVALHGVLEISTSDYQLQGEVMQFVSNVFTHRKIWHDQFKDSYTYAVELTAVCLHNFDFHNPQNYSEDTGVRILEAEADQYLLNITRTFGILVDLELATTKGADPHWVYHPSQRLDQVINEYKLFLPLMRILELSQNSKVLERTWKIIGFLCSCKYSPNNVENLVDNNWLNVIKLAQITLASQK